MNTLIGFLIRNNHKLTRQIARFGLAFILAYSIGVVQPPASQVLAFDPTYNDITVNIQIDEFGTDYTNCSLREAIYAANTNAPRPTSSPVQ